jgi:hypothetical protein
MFKSYDHFKKFSLNILNSIKTNPSKKLSECREEMAQQLIGSDLNTLKAMFNNEISFEEYFVYAKDSEHKDCFVVCRFNDESNPYKIEELSDEDFVLLVKKLTTEQNTNYSFFKDLFDFTKEIIKIENLDLNVAQETLPRDAIEYSFDILSDTLMSKDETRDHTLEFVSKTKHKFNHHYMSITGSFPDLLYFDEMDNSNLRFPDHVFYDVVSRHIERAIPFVCSKILDKENPTEEDMLNYFAEFIVSNYRQP